MSERDDRYVRDDLPRTTGEFRAAPDASASTAEFRAFAAGQDSQGRAGGATSWPEQPWAGDSPGRSGSGRMALVILGVVVVIAILVAIFLIG